MTFSKEDLAAWEDSEVMKEFEKIGKHLLKEDKDEENWEDEQWKDEKKLIDASDEFLEDSLEKELVTAYNNRLFYQLEKINKELINKSNIKVAYMIERTIQNIKTFVGGKNE